MVAAGLLMVYSAKTQNFPGVVGGAGARRADRPESRERAGAIASVPASFPGRIAARGKPAAKCSITFRLTGHFPNVGALARLRSAPQVPLLPLAKLKPAFVVRTPRRISDAVPDLDRGCIWPAFHVVFLVWRWSGLRGDFAILPAIHLLTGIGLILAVSLRDPLRDTLEFSKFAWGVALGCLVLAGAVAARRSTISASRVVLHAAVWRAWRCSSYCCDSDRARRQRRQGESGPVPAGGSDQDPAGVFPGWIFRAQLGTAARFA